MKKAVFLTLLLGRLLPASAQYLLGVSGSNYGGTNSLYLNPAQVADSRHKVYINLAGIDLFLTNNYLRYDAPYSLLSLLTNTVPARYRSAKKEILYRDEYFPETLDGRDKRLTLGGQLRGPSVLITLNDRFGVALSSRLRFGAALTGVSEPLARIIRYGTAESERVEPAAFGTGFALNADGYAEFAATFGGVLINEDVDFLKVGMTVKRLVGLYSGHILADNLAYRYVPDAVDPARENILLESVNARYGFTTEDAFRTLRLTPGFLVGNQSAGGGWGLDLGVVYEYRPNIGNYDYREKGVRRLDPGQNKYQYRLSVALLDLGRIRYKNPVYVSTYEVSRQNRLLDDRTFDKIGGSDDFTSAINQTLGVQDSERQTLFNSALPTALQVSVDYKLRENVYLNAQWVQRLHSTRLIGLAAPNVLAVTPRYERKWLEVAVPVALIDDYRALSLGLAVRLGPVFVGTDHLQGLVNIGKPRGFDVYAGASIPILRRRPPGPDACFYEKKEKSGWRRLLFWKE